MEDIIVVFFPREVGRNSNQPTRRAGYHGWKSVRRHDKRRTRICAMLGASLDVTKDQGAATGEPTGIKTNETHSIGVAHRLGNRKAFLLA